jgi:Immunity protein 42
MIIGDRSVFAIESSIAEALESPGQLGIGYFVIHLGGRCYGNSAHDSTLLACSFEEVCMRLANRGAHTASFVDEPDAAEIADDVHNAIYGEQQKQSYFRMPLSTFLDVIHSNHIIWAPDGDEAFDDGSFVLHFDAVDRVRLIAFRRSKGQYNDPNTLRDVWLAADLFYEVLEQWRDAFSKDWKAIVGKKG